MKNPRLCHTAHHLLGASITGLVRVAQIHNLQQPRQSQAYTDEDVLVFNKLILVLLPWSYTKDVKNAIVGLV